MDVNIFRLQTNSLRFHDISVNKEMVVTRKEPSFVSYTVAGKL